MVKDNQTINFNHNIIYYQLINNYSCQIINNLIIIAGNIIGNFILGSNNQKDINYHFKIYLTIYQNKLFTFFTIFTLESFTKLLLELIC